MVLAGPPESGLGNEVIVHVGEDAGLVVIRTNMQSLDAPSLVQRFQPQLAEAGRAIFRRHSRNYVREHLDAGVHVICEKPLVGSVASCLAVLIQSGVRIIAVHCH